jgi:transposase
MHRHELTDTQWRRIAPLLPCHGRRSMRGNRNFVNAVLWLMKTGSPWRDLPERYGNWKTVYNRFANWAKAGHFECIFKTLQLKVDLPLRQEALSSPLSRRGLLPHAQVLPAHCHAVREDRSQLPGHHPSRVCPAVAQSSGLIGRPAQDTSSARGRTGSPPRRRLSSDASVRAS